MAAPTGGPSFIYVYAMHMHFTDLKCQTRHLQTASPEPICRSIVLQIQGHCWKTCRHPQERGLCNQTTGPRSSWIAERCKRFSTPARHAWTSLNVKLTRQRLTVFLVPGCSQAPHELEQGVETRSYNSSQTVSPSSRQGLHVNVSITTRNKILGASEGSSIPPPTFPRPTFIR